MFGVSLLDICDLDSRHILLKYRLISHLRGNCRSRGRLRNAKDCYGLGMLQAAYRKSRADVISGAVTRLRGYKSRRAGNLPISAIPLTPTNRRSPVVERRPIAAIR